jgi:hypothetical protein
MTKSTWTFTPEQTDTISEDNLALVANQTCYCEEE